MLWGKCVTPIILTLCNGKRRIDKFNGSGSIGIAHGRVEAHGKELGLFIRWAEHYDLSKESWTQEQYV
jgi:hypothetical protein